MVFQSKSDGWHTHTHKEEKNNGPCMARANQLNLLLFNGISPMILNKPLSRHGMAMLSILACVYTFGQALNEISVQRWQWRAFL